MVNIDLGRSIRAVRKLRYTSHEKLLFSVAQLHYETGLTKSAIGRRLGVSVSHVARLVRAAVKTGIVEIRLRSPGHTALEQELCRAFGLRDARVMTAAPDEADTRAHLGAEAARLFAELARPGSRIGIGSGRTMYQMVTALPERPLPLELFPLALIADRSLDVRSIDAGTLVNTVWFKGRPQAAAMRGGFLAFPGAPFGVLRARVASVLTPALVRHFADRVAAASALFFSVGELRADSQIIDLTRESGLGVAELAAGGAVGDVLFRTVGADGRPVGPGLDGYILSPRLDALRRVSRAEGCAAVLVAGGRSKARVIRAALDGRYCNTLVTDDDTARRLLRHGARAA
jgi:deoxyribonucleoside regulator